MAWQRRSSSPSLGMPVIGSKDLHFPALSWWGPVGSFPRLGHSDIMVDRIHALASANALPPVHASSQWYDTTNHVIPSHCRRGSLLCFLQCLWWKGLAFSTVKGLIERLDTKREIRYFSNAASLVSSKAIVCRRLVQSVHSQVSVSESSEYRGLLAIGKSKAFAAV